MELAGRLAGARLTGGTARVVVASTPEAIPAPTPERLERAAQRATAARWLPRTTIRSRITRRTFRRSVVPCDRVRHPRAFSGLDLLSVLTIDLDRGLFSVARNAVMAGAQDVYASAGSLVVASRRYAAASPEGVQLDGGTTELHVFEAGSDPRTVYRGSGSVPGFVLNQFSMSEHGGVLRVATTEDAPWSTQGPAAQSESGVSVLSMDGGRLRTMGRVTGLGKGERIYAVRFLGERGYVVTFRQVDPLYTLDLRDPERPRVTGELKVTGFSSYLHPISDTLLLGIGQDATEQGRQTGPQVSLFDVGDPARPRLAGRASLGTSGASAAEQDHHAFLWWGPTRLAVVPVETYDGEKAFAGAVGFRVTSDAVSEVARIAHPAPAEDRYAPPIGRSIVVGDRLLTLSATGIQTSALRDLAPLAFTPLA
jgi:Beta propeller domain